MASPARPLPPLPPTPQLPEHTIVNLKALLRKYTSESTDPDDKFAPLPGVIHTVVDRYGNKVFSHAEGPLDISTPEAKIDDKSIMFLGSITSLVTSLACLIAVEHGKIGLDDWETLYRVVPELLQKKILIGIDEDCNPILKDIPEGCPKITMRLLLNHTSGFGSSFFNEDLWNFHDRDVCQDDIFGGWANVGRTPLIDEPGRSWHYGSGRDYAQKAVERIYGMKFGDFCDKYIFGPMNIHDTKWEPDESMLGRMMTMHHRLEDGSVIVSPAKNFARVSPAKNGGHHSGAGLFTTASDWNVILATVLNQGYCHTTGKRILKAEILEELFVRQLEPRHLPIQPMTSVRPEFILSVDDLDPNDPNKNFGLGLVIAGEKDGVMLPDGFRGKSYGSAWWASSTNVVLLIDREKGFAEFIASTLMPFPDPKLKALVEAVDSEIYRGLREGSAQ